ncbi:SWIM zinc finger family protein [Metarhizium acridum CQMa 102]|uniref:SWIM zinc finger family protein n=1 Tax=Metarhizium acridum (strain CQMa 102) TaxID=655827 RepID=E9DZF8_METAQ|nr:SWIM zinc finger family protein [Metarhizium acridum CQMa 102]EFY90890.1 SWIM zinc finger family protein [Metarhizium acridum CQMa 102]
MSSPLNRLGRLSLQEMPPMTGSIAGVASRAASSSYPDGQDSNASDTDSGDDDYTNVEGNEHLAIAQSPSRLLYNLDQLSDIRKAAVRDVFNEPPEIALQRCRRIGNTYAFQMTELVTRSIRIRAPEITETSPRLSCSCRQGDEAPDAPCGHLLWLLDQVLKQTLYNHDGSKPLNLNKYGYAKEMGDPFQAICDFHLDILADGLHCPVVKPYSYADEHDDLNNHRITEARELLASVYSTPPELFRPDIFTHPAMDDDRIIRRNDLDYTVLRMLLDNSNFFQYFLSLSRPSDPVCDVFRKLSKRVDHVLRELDSFSLSSCSPSPTSNCAETRGTADQTTARDVTWAARHLLGIVGLIRSSIYNRDCPLQSYEALSAARTLVQILASVVARNRDACSGQSRVDRNLYLRLVGDRGEDGFVIAELDLLPEAASHLVDSLEAILDQVELQGAPTAYVVRFRVLV